MTKAREAIQQELHEYAETGAQRPVLICLLDRDKLRCLNKAGEGDLRAMPAALATAGGFPTLAALLHLHSKVQGNHLPSLESGKEGACIVAVCGYPPTRADYGMAYRNGVKHVIGMTREGESACHEVTRVFEPWNRGELIQRDDKAGEKILDAEWVGISDSGSVSFDDLVAHPWFDRFLSPPSPGSVKIPDYLDEEELTSELAEKFTLSGEWQSHVHAERDSITWWVLVSLYTSFAWASQYPAYRSWTYLNQRKKPEARMTKEQIALEGRLDRQYGEFLDGLNVSGLLLDPRLKPVAWSFNSNRVNKTLHAETALVLAWLKGHRKEKEFKGYTFLSPWRSCCMCSAWISDVYRDSRTVWFIDDPGLPIRHLDHGANGATEVFLPKLLEMNVNTDPRFQEILDAFPWFRVMGMATHWDYNPGYREYLADLGRADHETGIKEKLEGPVDLFGSQEYFNYLSQAWDMTRELPTSVLELLDEAGELEAYVNNVWALRRCVMAFDERAL